MKVAHVPFTFAPDPVGGTEIYVETLAHSLRAHGIDSVILAPASTNRNELYEYNGLRVRRFRSARESKHMLRELYGAGDPEAAVAFAHILDQERPDGVHLHAFTRAVSVLVVRTAKQRGVPVFFTYHTPTVSCQRGTLMFLGKEVCDGALGVRRCASCALENRGLTRWAAAALSCVPPPLAHVVAKANLSGGMWTALRMSELVRARHEAFHELMSEVDGVVALSEWVRDLLVHNGVSGSKITLSRHGLPAISNTRQSPIDLAETPLRVAFLGRADRVKGADTIIKALRAAPDLRIMLHLYGIAQSAADEEYWTLLRSLAADDARITFFPPVPHDKVAVLLGGYHLLAVPSRWMETGPLVVLESFAAGTPVIGSKLGGIAELVQHQRNGLLVEPEDILAWVDALRRCGEDRPLLARLRKGVEPPRGMGQVAREMAQLYCRQVG